MTKLLHLLEEIRTCTICSHSLPFAPRPVLQFHPDAKILIAGQAPGIKVHYSGIPFDDLSGDRLRQWLGISRDIFYNKKLFAILPMGFCYPGKGKSGDLPPRRECAETWRKRLLQNLPALQTTLLLGKYAMHYHLDKPPASLTDTVKSWREYWPVYIPLPHPSPRNNIWLSKNPWFELQLLPQLKEQIKMILSD